MCNCSQALSQLSFIGETGVGIASITSEIVGLNTEITFHMTDGSTLGPIPIVNGTQGPPGSDGDDAELGSYVYQSYIGNPYETIPTATTGFANTLTTIAQNTLTSVGACVEFNIDLSFASGGLTPLYYSTNVYINAIGTITILSSHTKTYIKGTITRVSDTQVYIQYQHTTSAFNTVSNDFTYSGFINVSDLDTNDFDLKLYVVNNSGQNLLLNRFWTKISIVV